MPKTSPESIIGKARLLIKYGFELQAIIEMLAKQFPETKIEALFEATMKAREELYRMKVYPFVEFNKKLVHTHGVSFDTLSSPYGKIIFTSDSYIIVTGLLVPVDSETPSAFVDFGYNGADDFATLVKEKIRRMIMEAIRKGEKIKVLKVDDTCGIWSLKSVKEYDMDLNKKYNIRVQMIMRDIIFSYTDELERDRLVRRMFLFNLSRFRNLTKEEVIELGEAILSGVRRSDATKLFAFNEKVADREKTLS